MRKRTYKKLLLFLCLLFLLPTLALAEEHAEDGCTFLLPSGREDAATYLSDGDMTTRLTLVRQQALTATWTGEANGLLLHFYEPAARVQIDRLDPDGNVRTEETVSDTPYRLFVPTDGASAIRISCTGARASLAEIELCRNAETPRTTSEEPQQADLLLVLSGVTEETLELGAILPLYAREHDIRTGIVYIGEDYGYLVGEAFSALSEMALDIDPLFLHREDHKADTLRRIAANWDEKRTLSLLKSVLVQVRPRVIVTLDPQSGPIRAQYTAQLTERAVRQLVDAGELSSLQKLYLCAADGETVLDYTAPLADYAGETAQQAAQRGYAQYRSERIYGKTVAPNARFRLAYSTVGEDISGDDLFENIDTAALLQYAAPTPIPTPTPEPTPTIAPTDAPSADEPLPTEMPAASGAPDGSAGASVPPLFAFALPAAAAALLVAALLLRKKNTLLSRIAIAAAVLLLIASVIWLLPLAMHKREAAAAEPSPTPKPTATAAPTASPTPSPIPEPTPTPDPNAQYFRAPDDPAEVIVADYENGHWEYRTDTLSIIIDRISYMQGKRPQCKCVAHIRMRDADSFRSGVASNLPNAAAMMPPWKLARSYKAVLAITGDNLTNAEKEYKGILIRNGKLYSEYKREDTLVINPDLTLSIVKRGTVTGLQLLDSGVQNTYSFGPVLVENGVVNPDAAKHRVAPLPNPRCGIGMIEPGHWVAIVCDGRDQTRAYNVGMMDFAEMFAELGATLAYNLDGGSSAAMVFMGEHLNWHSGPEDPQRPWVDGLMWGYSEQVPTVNDPILHNGDGRVY